MRIVSGSTEEDVITQDWTNEPLPLLSICCITFNHVSYIEEAINSFLMQETNFPFEIIIHDDASTDGTSDIIRAYASKYPKIIKPIIQLENQFSKGGLINPRLVFPKAIGKYIALCEGDDYWTDNKKLQKQVEFLEANSEYVITYSDCVPFDENGVINTNFGGAKRDLKAIELKKSTPIFTLTACFRNVITEIPQDVMSARFGDLVMWSLLGQYGKGKYLPNISPSRYRVHDGGVFSKKGMRQKYEMDVITRAALLAYWDRVGDKELCDFYRKEVLRSSMISTGLSNIPKIYFDILIPVSYTHLTLP
ncbi:MAG: glycosyltransferase, partial [Pseudomonadales bacterium]|nr:glycosyltransferase [Pseudomonadales bacterium]